MKTQIKEIKDKKIWEDFLMAQNKQRNFLQSWNWGECHHLCAQKIYRFGFYDSDNCLKGIALLIKQKSKRGSYFECPGGPIINWEDQNYINSFVSLLKTIGRDENCRFARIRPQILNNPDNCQKLSSQGFIPAPMHLHAQDTWVLDITENEQVLLKKMRKTTRYLIKKAIKENVQIIQSDSQQDIKTLFMLQKETARRHGFIPFPLSFFLAHFRAFRKDNQIKIFKAVWQKKVLSIAMIVFFADRAVYHYSASKTSYSKIPASYLIQWEAIKEARKRGCRIYDFWGIAPENAGPKHRFAGVTLFKKGFGGYPISYLPAHDLPLTLAYWPIYIFESARRISRRL